jgi:hypothetical protein
VNLFQRLQGVFFDPKRTFDGLAAKPVWIDALVLVIVVLIAFNIIVAPYAQKDMIQLAKDNAALQQQLGDVTYAEYIELLENPSKVSQILQAIVITPLVFILALLLQALLLLIFGRFGSTQGTYVKVLAVLVHASVIDRILGNAVRLPLALMQKSVMQTSTGLALLFPKLEVMSMPYVILAQIDLFQLWMFGILAFGLAAVFKISHKKALVLSYTMWVLKALFNIGLGILQMIFYR